MMEIVPIVFVLTDKRRPDCHSVLGPRLITLWIVVKPLILLVPKAYPSESHTKKPSGYCSSGTKITVGANVCFETLSGTHVPGLEYLVWVKIVQSE